MIDVGDAMTTSWDFSKLEGYHEYIEGCSVQRGFQ